MMPKSSDELISVKAAAQKCNRNPETIRRWVWSGKLPAEKLGNQLFIKESALESYCRETAGLAYAARPQPGAGSYLGNKRGEHMKETDKNSQGATAILPGSRSAVIESLRELREQIHARMGRDFTEDEFTEMLNLMHEDHDEESSSLR
jgi:excisionase family DNA binding protein